MELRRYLSRINYDGNTQPSPKLLAHLLQCHVFSVPFENLDIQLGIPVVNDVEAVFEKIVGRNRGGWCYEQNGLFGWALSEIGFDVTRVAATTRRDERDPEDHANHLCLLVRMPEDCDTRYLADVGFGSSMIRPIPLEESWDEQAPFRLGLRRLEDGHWQFREESGADAVAFDFLAEPGNESEMSARCVQLQTDPNSKFVLNLVAQIRTPDTHIALRGRVLTVVSASGTKSRTLQSCGELMDILRNTFLLDVPEVASLWDRIDERHKQLFND